ncbi:NERD domain-containing protein [Virgibacillus doumboii]|uniref:NERD domain-containing protein n=1 Tax=Virgibacillus doumboii TaxID=2697503 RepID=UPI0013DE8892|nr:NERD domain-containing protein [Virgibacillus doumboii]
MAQLIKLQDYISRYEWNAYRYPSQFIRVKQDNWNKLHKMWEDEPVTDEEEHTEPASAFSKLKSFMKTGSWQEEEPAPDDHDSLPKTENELRHYFLDKLFPLQLKWASSTVTDVSFMDRGYYEDDTLKFFLKRFPDTYLLMYFPIFNIKKAPIDGEIIFLSPIGIEIIYLMDKEAGTTIVAGDERTWLAEGNKEQSKMLSPMIALKRTEKIIKGILSTENIEFPIKKVVLSSSNKIKFDSEPYNTRIIGMDEFDKWFKEKRSLVSPLKNRQLKITELLLKNCQTTAVKRPEWEEDDTNTFTMGTEGE